jgi:hypothetical protein
LDLPNRKRFRLPGTTLGIGTNLTCYPVKGMSAVESSEADNCRRRVTVSNKSVQRVRRAAGGLLFGVRLFQEGRATVSALNLSLVAFAFIFGGALLGMLLRSVLPEPHLNADSRDVVRLGTGLLATLAALVVGLLIASAQSSFQTQSNQIKQITANIVLLDNLLARSGPQSAAAPSFVAGRRQDIGGANLA